MSIHSTIWYKCLYRRLQRYSSATMELLLSKENAYPYCMYVCRCFNESTISLVYLLQLAKYRTYNDSQLKSVLVT